MVNIKIIFLPKFSNPYQDLLIESLKNLGVEVLPFKPKRLYLFLPSINIKQIDIIHFHWLHPFFSDKLSITAFFKVITFFVQLIILKIFGKKIVWTAHNIKDHEDRHPVLDRLSTKFITYISDAIITHCEKAKELLIEKFYIKNNAKIEVIPHGNFIDYYKNETVKKQARILLGIPESKTVFLFLGQIRPYKGVLELIKAHSHAADENSYLLIAGTPINKKFENLIYDKIGSKKQFDFRPGFVPEDEIQLYVNCCDAVVFPYHDILTSGAIILAMSFGRACIAPTIGCMPETVDQSGAFLYDPNARYGLRTAIQKAIQNKSELQKMGTYNQQIAKQWNWCHIGMMTAKVYKACINDSNSRLRPECLKTAK